MSRLSDRLAADNITTVCYIDDENSGSKVESTDQAGSILAGLAEPDLSRLEAAHPALAGISQGLPEDVLERAARLTRWLDEGIAAGKINAVSLGGALAGLQNATFAPSSVARLLEAFFRPSGAAFMPVSFGEWDARAGEILGAAAPESRVLLLVDRTNDHEETATDGLQVISNLFRDHAGVTASVDCIVVTSKFRQEQELSASHDLFHEVKQAIQNGGGPKARKIFVLSKDRLSAEDAELEDQFFLHFDRIKAARLSRELAEASRSILMKAVDDAADWLEEVSLPEFHWSVFRTAETEGASEIQTLLRLVGLKQSLSLESEFPTNQRIVDAVLGLRSIPKDSVSHSATPSELEGLRRLEFVREGSHLNPLHLPIACGDVFEISRLAKDGTPETREAILLGNPCDLVLREDGKRKASFGLLVPVDRVSVREWMKAGAAGDGNEKGPALTITYATGGRPEDTVYVMKPSRAQTIPLAILDLTWVNADGVARLSSAHAAPSNLLSLSQQEARKKMKPKDTERYPAVTILGFKLDPHHVTEKVPGVGDVNSLQYPLRRTWRFRKDYAAAALLAFTQHMARPAFEHDFLRGWKAGEEQSSGDED